MKKLLLFLSLIGSSVTLVGQTTSVFFPLNTLFGGAAYNQPLTLTAANTLVSDGQNLWAGTYTIIPASTTNPVVQLYPNTYLMTVPGLVKPVRFTVPASTNTLNVATLVVTGPLFYFGTNGMANLMAAGNLMLVTNSDGSITVSDTFGAGNVITNDYPGAANLTATNALALDASAQVSPGLLYYPYHGLPAFEFYNAGANLIYFPYQPAWGWAPAIIPNYFTTNALGALGGTGTGLVPSNVVVSINAGQVLGSVAAAATVTGAQSNLIASAVQPGSSPWLNGINITNVPPTSYLGFVAGQGRCPISFYAGNTTFQSEQAFIAEADITNIMLVYANWYGNNETGPGASATIAASVRFNGTTNQITFGGLAHGTALNGQNLFSDLKPQPLIPRGSIFIIRSWSTNSSGLVYDQGWSGPYDRAAYSSSSPDDTMSNDVISLTGMGNNMWGPIAVIGNTTLPSVGIMGDSRDFGFGDVLNNAGTGLSPSVYGGIDRLLAPFYGTCNLSIPGDKEADYLAHTNRMLMTNFMTAVWTDLGINNLFTAVSDLTNFCALLRPRPVYAETLSPDTTSGNGWMTIAGQTVTGNEVYRTNFNAIARLHQLPYLAGIYDTAAFTEYGGAAAPSGFWNVWATTNVPGLNSAAQTNMTIDGLHGDYFAALAANTGDPLRMPAPNIPAAFFATTLSGVFSFSGGMAGPTNASAPGNTSTPKAWANYTNSSGGLFKLPLYQ